ncbi:hypothetical protein ACLB2K_012428 [Fragaria x ananassa]
MMELVSRSMLHEREGMEETGACRLLVQTVEGEIECCKDLKNAPIVKLPDELMYLFNLKYLNLRGTLAKELPEAIGKLRNLQTLDFRYTYVEANWKTYLFFCSLHSLTCLHLHWSRLEEDLLPHIEGLPCLESATLLNAYVGKELSFTRGFLKLTRLSLKNFPSLEMITLVLGTSKLHGTNDIGAYLRLFRSDLRSPYKELWIINRRQNVSRCEEVMPNMQCLGGYVMKDDGELTLLTTFGITNLKGSEETVLCVSITPKCDASSHLV